MNRSQLPDGYFHVTAHAVEGENVFRHEGDRRFYASLLDKVASEHGWRILAFAFMGNHVHLVLHAEVARLSAGMLELQGRYVRRMNALRGRKGHLFRRRFHSKPILSEHHLVGCIRYVAINPWKDGFVARPEDWKWSSHRTLAGIGVPAPFVAVEEALAFVGGREAYVALVAEYERETDAWVARGQTPPPLDTTALSRQIDERGDIALVEMHAAGVALSTLAAMLGCSKATVCRRVRAAG